ncbi:uncharacterized protein LOC135498384 [Lineus longissimus]|uniref:uncharacterized protein LOC135498384 n=1 Tax=Lineus longissimus TaxID=88925 RepID=UPI00315C86B5
MSRVPPGALPPGKGAGLTLGSVPESGSSKLKPKASPGGTPPRGVPGLGGGIGTGRNPPEPRGPRRLAGVREEGEGEGVKDPLPFEGRAPLLTFFIFLPPVPGEEEGIPGAKGFGPMGAELPAPRHGEEPGRGL